MRNKENYRNWRIKNKKRLNKSLKIWRKSNPKKVKLQNSRSYQNSIPNRQTKKFKEQSKGYKLKHRYGITKEEYDAMLIKQKNCCGLCGYIFVNQTPCVDHDHRTGKVRMLLHNKCNSLLGLVNDNRYILNSAIEYLDKF